ncbi:MAG: ABC transporter permease [Thermomicrobiales bacterium]|nr:ABC transporter permease [Thermomicrobiales bacterium]
MARYLIRRLIHSAFLIWGVATLVFFAIRLVPGDPVVQMLGPEYTPEAADAMRQKLGLDESIGSQYVKWMGDLLRGDMGSSIATNETVVDAIRAGLPKTLSLSLVAFIIGVGIALPTGILAALKRNTWIDYLASLIAFIGVSMPGFWLGILLIIVFSVNLGWFPALGYAELRDDGFRAWIERLILPGIAIGTAYAAILMRFVRAGLLETMSSDYIRTARAKGVAEPGVIARHAMRNALIPVVTVMGIQLALLLSGTVAVEMVFSIRGIGRILIGAIFDRDYPMVQGIVLLIAVIFVLANLAVDILYTAIDPRIRYA